MTFFSNRFRLFACALATVLALGACGGGGDSPAASNTPPPPSVAPSPAADVPASFAVDSRLRVVGLGFTVEAYPIALFTDGRALTDTVGLLFPAGLAAHRAQFSSAWTQWRQSGADVQILQGDGSWKTIMAINVAPLQTGQFTFAGIYESLSVASSPSMSIISSSQYTFTHAGAFGKGSYVIGDTAGVGAIGTTPDRRGTYTIDGYRLTLTLENGTTEHHVIVFDETDPDGRFIFIDGAMYSID